MPFGYTGNVLHVNLTSKKSWIEHPDEKFYRTYFGGQSLALYYLLKEMKRKVDPFSPDNVLVFATSVIVGTTAPTISRYSVCAKSPLTGAMGQSEAGGWWGPELKKAGVDAIIIKGSSKVPVYLWINNGKLEIRDAKNIWGKETGIAQKIIKKELGDNRIRVLQIGQAGENLVRFANIVNELKHFNGRTGLGAVMGSKKLKAIAVRGTQDIQVSDKEKLSEITKQINRRINSDEGIKNFRELGTIGDISTINEAGWLPTNNWTRGGDPIKGKNLTAETMNKTMLKGTEGCYACPIRCKRVVEINDSDIKVDPIYGGPEYENAVALGSLCGVYDWRYVAKANELCNKYTMDAISTGAVIAFAMQCYQEGILTKQDTNKIELNFGNKEAMVKMVEMIALREGIGSLLAEGSYRASLKIGKGSEKYIHQVKGQEIPMHDPRVKTAYSLQYALSNFGADHNNAPPDRVFEGGNFGGLSGLGIIEPLSLVEIVSKKVVLYKIVNTYFSLIDVLGVCDFGIVPLGETKLDELLEIIRSITGWEINWFELMKVGERSINMGRIFNYREGFTSKNDDLPKVFFQNFKGGILDGQGAIDETDFKQAVKLYYEIMGWSDDGIPSRGKLIELGLNFLKE